MKPTASTTDTTAALGFGTARTAYIGLELHALDRAPPAWDTELPRFVRPSPLLRAAKKVEVRGHLGMLAGQQTVSFCGTMELEW